MVQSSGVISTSQSLCEAVCVKAFTSNGLAFLDLLRGV
jgi:hypothetical protein